MAFNDALSDMLAKLKMLTKQESPIHLVINQSLNVNVLAVLKDEGYIRDYKILK